MTHKQLQPLIRLDVRFGSLADKPSQAKIHRYPLLLE